jgi:hypothetical protein
LQIKHIRNSASQLTRRVPRSQTQNTSQGTTNLNPKTAIRWNQPDLVNKRSKPSAKAIAVLRLKLGNQLRHSLTIYLG